MLAMRRWVIPSNIPTAALGGKSLFGAFTQSIGQELAHFPVGPALTDKFWCAWRRIPFMHGSACSSRGGGGRARPKAEASAASASALHGRQGAFPNCGNCRVHPQQLQLQRHILDSFCFNSDQHLLTYLRAGSTWSPGTWACS